MEQFNLDKWLKNKNRKVVTRQGKSVRIICTDRRHTDSWPIVALEDYKDGEFVIYANIDGRTDMCSENIHDLFFADEEELTEFEKEIKKIMDFWYNDIAEVDFTNAGVKEISFHILDLARKEVEKSNQYSGNQKQVWGEKDEKMWSQVINEIEAIKSNSSTVFEKNIAQDKIDWLKSIKDRVQPQPKQEWSEDDKSMYIRTLGILGKCYMGELPTKVEEELKWLKSIEPQSHWKPSEYDISLLEEIAGNIRNNVRPFCSEVSSLEDLIKNIKTL